MAAPPATRVAVVGAGAFGRNHLRVYRELEHELEHFVPHLREAKVGPADHPLAVHPVPHLREAKVGSADASVHLAAVVDPNPTAAQSAADQYSIPAFPSVEALLAAGLRVDAASICVPTLHHLAAAEPLLAAGIDLLIEKPLAPTLAQADTLIDLAEKHGRILQTGHLERFNPAVTAARTLLHRPMFFEAHRLSVFTPRSLDVDVVLDLMIHDLDIVLSLVDSPVHEVRAVGLPVLSSTVDIANVRVEFANGCVANFTASRVSTERVRKLRFFQPHQYLSLDFARQDLLLIDVTAAAGLSPADLAALIEKHSKPEAPGEPRHPTAGLNMSKVPVAPGEPLRLELESFLHAGL